MEIVILCFAGVQQYLVNDLEICAKIFNHRLESYECSSLFDVFRLIYHVRIPAVAQELERILGTKEIPQIFNLDNVFRQMFSSVLQGSKARPRQLGKNEKKSGNSRADDLPATIDEEPSKKRLLKILSPRENDSTGRCNEQPSTFRKIENPLSSRIGEIMAGFVRAKKRKPAKVVQIRLIAVLDDDSIEVEDPWPKDPSNPSIWTLNNADVVDYLSFKYTAKDFREGDFVYALFRMDGEVSSEFYAGMIAKINSENVTVQFEDSDCEVVDFNQIIKGSDVPERHSLPSAPASAK